MNIYKFLELSTKKEIFFFLIFKISLFFIIFFSTKLKKKKLKNLKIKK